MFNETDYITVNLPPKRSIASLLFQKANFLLAKKGKMIPSYGI